LISYLRSPELEGIVRQLFATTLVGPKDGSTLETVKGEFLRSMSKYLDVDEARLQPFAASFLDGLVSGVEDSLKSAIEKNVLSAHEAKSASRHRVLLDELANLKTNLAFLETERALDINSIIQFETKYREQVGCVHAHIRPPHLESGRRVPRPKFLGGGVVRFIDFFLSAHISGLAVGMLLYANERPWPVVFAAATAIDRKTSSARGWARGHVTSSIAPT
jgi:hypothetical protein